MIIFNKFYIKNIIIFIILMILYKNRKPENKLLKKSYSQDNLISEFPVFEIISNNNVNDHIKKIMHNKYYKKLECCNSKCNKILSGNIYCIYDGYYCTDECKNDARINIKHLWNNYMK